MNRRLFMGGLMGGLGCLMWQYVCPSITYGQGGAGLEAESSIPPVKNTTSSSGAGGPGESAGDGLELVMRNVCLRPFPYQLEWPRFYISPDVEVSFRLHALPKGFSPGVIIPISLTHEKVYMIGRDGIPTSYDRKKVMKQGALSPEIIHSYEGILGRCERTAVSLETNIEVKGDEVVLSNEARTVIVKNRCISRKAAAAERFILFGKQTPGRTVSKFTDDRERTLIDLPGYLLGVDDLGFSIIDEGGHE